MAAPVVGRPRAALTVAGRRFYKLSGSGNDFVFFDVRDGMPDRLDEPAAVAALCARGEGVGADGVVFLDVPEPGVVRMVYLNSDGSRASLCGNATLCTARLALHLGVAGRGETFRIRTDTGDLRARVGEDDRPAFELAPLRDLLTAAPGIPEAVSAGLEHVGYAVAGVPHLVAVVADAQAVDLDALGRALRPATPERPAGANVNVVSSAGAGRWRMRTYERGVEGETLACGTGAVACAALLNAWGLASPPVELFTLSGRVLRVEFDGPDRTPTLAGEGRVVFIGELADAA